ncbi:MULTISPECIES: type IV pilus assembly protein PilM [Cellulomonas]|uniref:type IV pilus assembly protein PilM n=1 Tax=Cellulomonas TaxID=1707 RepID=UPI0010A835BB|nr:MULTISPECIES: type IV pilus assembly protein PilM [Cellulomonas]
MASERMIGLDIGSTSVRASELEFGKGARSAGGSPTLLRTGHVELPPGAVRDGEVAQPDIVATALRRLWSQARFESKDVAIGVGNQRVVVRELELPWLPLGQLKASLPFQVHELLPMSTDEALLDYLPTAEGDGPQGRVVNGLLVAAQRDTVTANVLAVEAAGLRPVMVDLNGFALLRSLARGDVARSTAALVDVGATVTTVVVVDHGQPRLVRFLPVGGHNVTVAVAAAAGVTPAEAETLKQEVGIGVAPAPGREAVVEAVTATVRSLVEAVRNTLVYFTSTNPGHGIEVMVLTGRGAQLPGFGQYLSSASRLPAILGDPLAGVRHGKAVDRDALRGHESSLAVSVGLAYGVAA